jgi:hypothetical protein
LHQNNLNELRKWFNETQKYRDEETERLETELTLARYRVDQARHHLSQEKIDYLEEKYGKTYKPEEVERFSVYDNNLTSSLNKAYKAYELTLEWQWKIERRLHDLIRDERDDLDYMARLAGREKRKHQATNNNVGSKTVIIGNKRNRQHKKISHKAEPEV